MVLWPVEKWGAPSHTLQLLPPCFWALVSPSAKGGTASLEAAAGGHRRAWEDPPRMPPAQIQTSAPLPGPAQGQSDGWASVSTPATLMVPPQPTGAQHVGWEAWSDPPRPQVQPPAAVRPGG